MIFCRISTIQKDAKTTRSPTTAPVSAAFPFSVCLGLPAEEIMVNPASTIINKLTIPAATKRLETITCVNPPNVVMVDGASSESDTSI